MKAVNTKGSSFSPLSLLWKTGAEIYPGKTLRDYLKRFVHLAYLSPNVELLGKWLRCSDNPALARETERSPIILRRLHRPYLHKDWTIPRRLEAIDLHYRALANTPARLLDIADEDFFDLIDLGESYAGLRIVIDRPRWMRSEGEIAVSLFQDVHRVYSAMFIIQGDGKDLRLTIGALQGAVGEHIRETYVRLTRLLHGARPRDFLVAVTQILASNLGCCEVWGLADANHRGEHKLVNIDKRASFDEVWIDHGGKLNGEGFFVMGARVKRRDPDAIPPRKRALYRRRYQLFDRIESAIREVFSEGKRKIKHHDPACLQGTHPAQDQR
jgi:uncharacterized protein